MSYVFGIDLGTTYSCISYVDEMGLPVVIKNSDNEDTTASVVYFENSTNVVTGNAAKESSILYPKQTVSFVKQLMGKSDHAIDYNGESLPPAEVSAHILKKLVQDAAKSLGVEESDIKDVVITCPAYFGTAEKAATEDAGEIANLNVLEIIDEPTAAAIHYAIAKGNDSKTFMVYDLGGGTFDVVIMNISGGNIKLLCTEGDHELGGKDWDKEVGDLLERRFREMAKEDYETRNPGTEIDEYNLNDFEKQDLVLKSEKAKRDLTNKDKATAILTIAGITKGIDVTRSEFDNITLYLLDRTIGKANDAISVAKDKGYEVEEILLVGGSTYMVQVAERLTEEYGIKPRLNEPNAAVAKGASLYAYNLGKKPKLGKPAPPLPVIEWIATKSYAVRVWVSDTEEKCLNMIFKNSDMPDGVVSVIGKFGTYSANLDAVDVKVYESEIDDRENPYYEVDENYFLAAATFDLDGTLPKDAPLEATLTLNNEGILRVTGRDLTNKQILMSEGKEYATMNATGFMSREKVFESKKRVGGISTR